MNHDSQVKLMIELKKQLGLVSHIIVFNKKIKCLNLAWKDYEIFMENLAQKLPSQPNLIHDEYHSLRAELLLKSLLSALYELREFLKNNIVKTTKAGNITDKLISQYEIEQLQYKKLLTETINQGDLYKWLDALRNVVIHAGDMLFGFFHFQANTSKGEINKAYLICDYELLEKKKIFKEKKLPLDAFYFDQLTIRLRMLKENLYKVEYYSPEEVQKIEEEIRLRCGSYKKLSAISKGEIETLLKDQNFLFYYYNEFRKKGISSQGIFTFNISDLIKHVYKTHKIFYETLYHILCGHHNEDLKALVGMIKEANKLSKTPDSMVSYCDLNLSLDIKE